MEAVRPCLPKRLFVLVAALAVLCAGRPGGAASTTHTQTLTAAVSSSETLSVSSTDSAQVSRSVSMSNSARSPSTSGQESATASNSAGGTVSAVTLSQSEAASRTETASPSRTINGTHSRQSVTPSTSGSARTPSMNISTTPSLSRTHSATEELVPTKSPTASFTNEETLTLSTSRSHTRSGPSPTLTATLTATMSRSLTRNDDAERLPSFSVSLPSPTHSSERSSTKSRSRSSNGTLTESHIIGSATVSSTFSASASPTTEVSASPASVSASSGTMSLSNSASISTSPTVDKTASASPSASKAVTRSPQSVSVSTTASVATSGSVSVNVTITLPLPPTRTPSASPEPTASATHSPSEVASMSSTPTTSRSPSGATISLPPTWSMTPSETGAQSNTKTVSIDSSSPSATDDVSSTPSASPSRSDSSSHSSTMESSTSYTGTHTTSFDASHSVSGSQTTTGSLTVTNDQTIGTWSSSSSRETSATWTRMTSRRRGSISESRGSPTLQWSSTRTPSKSESPSTTQSQTQSERSATLIPSLSSTSSHSRSPSSSRSATSSFSRSPSVATAAASTTVHRGSSTHAITATNYTQVVTLSASGMHSATLSDAGGSPTNNNKSYTRTRSGITVTQLITVTETRIPTLTLTQSIVLNVRLSNALTDYLLDAFDFTAASSNGPCSATASLLSLILIACCVVAVATLVYRRFVRKERPDLTKAGLVPPWRVLARENVYLSVVLPCHFHCWWIHCLTCLVHLNMVFLLTACILYAFEKRSSGGGGLLSGTSALGVVSGIIGAALPHAARPLIDGGFFFVTYFVDNRRRCQNEDGMTWDTWHRLAEERRLQHEAERQALAKRMEEDRKSGLHMLRTALTTEVDDAGWEEKGATCVSRPTSPTEIAIDVPFNAISDLTALRAATHDVDLCIQDTETRWEPQAHDDAASMQERHQRLEAKWSTPLSQPWWGPVETHHLLVGASMTLAVIAMLSGFQNAIHKFSPSSCFDRTSPLAVALLVCFFVDVLLFEPVHQLLRLMWRYALEHEGNVDYTSTLSRRLAKLITLQSVAHPYRGAMLLWPEESLAEGTAYGGVEDTSSEAQPLQVGFEPEGTPAEGTPAEGTHEAEGAVPNDNISGPPFLPEDPPPVE